jgi:phosphoserine phosphatase
MTNMEILKMKYSFLKSLLLFIVIFQVINATAALNNDPLPSWNDTPTKQKIIQFVQDVTNQNRSRYVKPEERIAVFDNDGTLWIEQPLYTQAIFAFDQVRKLAPQHSEWQTEQPFKAILTNDRTLLANLSLQDIEKILAATHTGMTVDAFQDTVKNWLTSAKNPHFNRPYTQLIYQPMLELMDYLRTNNFKVYIVSGGGQEFIRAFAEQTYKIPPEQVIGSAVKTKYTYQNGKPVLIKKAEVQFVDDKTGKPEAINLIIGRKPLMAFGNSDGDRQMLEWTQSRNGPFFTALVHHDDAKREFAYDTQSKVGTFSNALMAEAKKNNWTIISMKNDWQKIFPNATAAHIDTGSKFHVFLTKS